MTTDQQAFAWFKALNNILESCVPNSVRLDVLRRLTDDEIERQKKAGELQIYTAAEFVNDPKFREYLKYHGEVMEAYSIIIQVLTRLITNNHSPEDAAKILFREHRRGTGSRWLPDYLDNLPGIEVDRKLCLQIAETETEKPAA